MGMPREMYNREVKTAGAMARDYYVFPTIDTKLPWNVGVICSAIITNLRRDDCANRRT
jgi:hypothetical protein